MKKIVLFVFLSFFMIGNASALKIVSLGDSIPGGVLLEDPNKSYDNRIAETLNAEFYEYSVSGITTNDLLKALDKEEVKENIKDADIVFINIGSGDLLDLTDDIDFSGFGFNPKDKMDLKNGATEEFKKYLVDAFKNKMGSKLEDVLNNFELKFDEFIEKIKTYNPNVKIYVNNAYNPFFSISIPIVLDLSEIEKGTENAIKKFNDLLNSDKYTVINIYDILRNNEYLNIDPLNNSFDPHPNLLGHDKIYEQYLKELCYKITYDGKDYYILKGDTFNIEPKEKKGYTFLKWNYDLNKIDKDIELKEVYKKNINYLYFIIPGVLLGIIFVIIIKKKH